MIQKQEQRTKDKIRALERLKDLERIQKYNEEKLQRDLKKYEPKEISNISPKNGITSLNSKNFNVRTPINPIIFYIL